MNARACLKWLVAGVQFTDLAEVSLFLGYVIHTAGTELADHMVVWRKVIAAFPPRACADAEAMAQASAITLRQPKTYNMKFFYYTLFILGLSLGVHATAQTSTPRFRVLALSENGGHHIRYSEAAKKWLNQLAADSNFAIDYISNTETITPDHLSHYQLFIQLDYPPYAWKKEAAAAFTSYIDEGRGGWIGFHHATLLGEFDGYPLWNWFYRFMGSIRFKDYIPDFADGKVSREDSLHPCMKGLPKEFIIQKEEWYTYDKSPRPNVHVLASVDESTYEPASTKKMGDHPVVWTNTKVKARNVYIFMGHSPDLFNNIFYTRLFRNAIFWSAGGSL